MTLSSTSTYAGDAAGLFAAWEATAQQVTPAVAAVPRGEKIVWFGPPLSPTWFLTGRLMETWAHGQDIVDALGISREPTDRLRHIADMGVRTREWSYALRGRTCPAVPVRVELTGPGRGRGGPMTPPTPCAAPRWTSACWSPSAGTGLDLSLRADGPAARGMAQPRPGLRRPGGDRPAAGAVPGPISHQHAPAPLPTPRAG